MKVKYYMRGIGVGIILTVILFSFGKKERMNDNLNNKDINQTNSSDEFNEAKGINMDALRLDPTVTPLPSIISQEVTPIVPETSGVSENVTPTVTVSPEEITSEPTNADQVQEEKLVQSVDEQAEMISVKISNGMYSEKVAKELEKYGVIEHWEEYNQYLEDLGYTKKIRADVYEIKKGSTFEEITDIIMKKN